MNATAHPPPTAVPNNASVAAANTTTRRHPAGANATAPLPAIPAHSNNTTNATAAVVRRMEPNATAPAAAMRNATNVSQPGPNQTAAAKLPVPRPAGNATGPDPIPVLGVSVFVNADLLVRLLDSVDYPVGRIVIIHNGRHPGVATVLQRLRTEHPEWTIESHPENLGCAGAWNRVLAADPDAPYHLIVNDDIRFFPGALGRFHASAIRHIADVAAGRSNRVILFPTHGDLMWYSPPWSCFAILRHAVQTVGRFDENFWPVYHEDYDYMVRMARADLWQELVPEAKVQHGWSTGKYEAGMDRAAKDQGKVAVLEEYQRQQHRHERGSPYYALKWGTAETPGIYDAGNGYWNKKCTVTNGVRTCTPMPPALYPHPFNDSSLPLSFWVFDPKLRRCFETGEGSPCRYNASLLVHPDLVPHDAYNPGTRQWRRRPRSRFF
jgi:hypothetical protein